MISTVYRQQKGALDSLPSPGPDEIVILHFAVGLVDANSANAGIVLASSSKEAVDSHYEYNRLPSSPISAAH